jgi:hypothetical protein
MGGFSLIYIKKGGLGLCADAAECFLSDAEPGGDHAEWYAVEQCGIGSDELPITVVGGGKMQVVKALLQLYDAVAEEQSSQAVDVRVFLV